MPVIRVSEANFECLQKWAEPLVDSADDALSKALAAAERYRLAQEKSGEAASDLDIAGMNQNPAWSPNGQRTPQKDPLGTSASPVGRSPTLKDDCEIAVHIVKPKRGGAAKERWDAANLAEIEGETVVVADLVKRGITKADIRFELQTRRTWTRTCC